MKFEWIHRIRHYFARKDFISAHVSLSRAVDCSVVMKSDNPDEPSLSIFTNDPVWLRELDNISDKMIAAMED